MKRGINIATGIIVLLAMVFFSGFVIQNVASAAGEDSNDISANGSQNIDDLRLDINMKHLQSIQLPDLLQSNGVDAKTATTDKKITKNTTLSGTYKQNILVYPGVTVTVKSNVTINGDLVLGGSMKMTAGTLTVNGDIQIGSSGSIYTSGASKINVNKAAAGGKSGYTGAHFIIWDDNYGNMGLLNMSGSSSLTINNMAKGCFWDYGKIKMSSSASITAKVPQTVFDGDDTDGCLNSGTINVFGDFYQDTYYTVNSYRPGPNFVTNFIGSTSVKKIVIFKSGNSYVTKFSFIGGSNFTSDSVISINKSLTSDMTIDGGQSYIEFQGNLNSHHLTINSSLSSPTPNGSLWLDGGMLTINGTFCLGMSPDLVMDNANEKVTINGDFNTFGADNRLDKGQITINGNFHQFGRISNDSYSDNSYCPGADLITEIQGVNRKIIFDSPKVSGFTKFELAPGASIDSSSIVSIGCKLSGDVNWKFQKLYFVGDLAGHTLTFTGDMVIPDSYQTASSTIVMNGGKLSIIGNLQADGHLMMTNKKDIVRIDGNFIKSSGCNSSDFLEGELFVSGDFKIEGASTSYNASNHHTTIFNGSGPQSVTFATNSYLNFCHVIVLNDKLNPSDIPGTYTDLIVTGESLSDIDTNAGCKLVPTFNPSKNNYIVLLPDNLNWVTITPNLLDKYGANSWMTVGAGSTHVTSFTLYNVAVDKNVTKKVIVHAYNDLETRTYTFTAEKLSANLSGLGTLPAGSYVDQPFDKGTADYTVQLPETAASFVFAPLTSNPDSTLTVSLHGHPAGTSPTATVYLSTASPKNTAKYDVIVTAQDKSTTKTYTVTFTRRDPLSGITVSTGTLTPAFSSGKASYSVYVPSTTGTIDITAVRNTTAPDCSKVTLNGNELAGDKLTLALTPGCAIPVAIQAWDADGKTVSAYTVTVYSIMPVSNISVSTGTLSPAFSMGVPTYTDSLPATTASVTVSVTKTASLKSMTINGAPAVFNGAGVATCVLSPAVGGSATAKIVAIAQNGATYTYTVNAKRAPLLTGIKLSTGALKPVFNATTLTYEVDVAATIKSVTITPILAATGVKSFTINNNTVKSIVLKPAAGGSAKATIVVTATNGMKVTYTVVVKRAK